MGIGDAVQVAPGSYVHSSAANCGRGVYFLVQVVCCDEVEFGAWLYDRCLAFVRGEIDQAFGADE